ncbi:winged helix-turn-helix domain-containing protein [Thalassotalea sp. ND16A]|uniref:winged helix-turn-helix domain-containing protein n=1 Tax=Thalassotalea sp. ND16A TaxID=1535422 RepID=UPI00051A3A1F|nr:winged helix-turn-helix domain-containing protein [Thalassotalea sp. ND16A]KGJ89432.1 putative transcriptional regulator, CadC [Thalassotalea sp. ND16A]
MRYKFKEFNFDSASLVLMKNGEVISIRHNEAKVLALLLENVDKVISKEGILSDVWQDKVVSEQAVFQNISSLRSLFGSQAIKTFPKRGYQWQLSTKPLTDDLPLTAAPVGDLSVGDIPVADLPVCNLPIDDIPVGNLPVENVSVKSAQTGYWPYVFLLSLLVIVIGFFTWPNNTAQESHPPAIRLAYIPIVDQQATTRLALLDNDKFDYTELTHINSANFLTSAELEYPNLAERYPFILTGKIREYQQKVYLDFLLKGPYVDWQGQLYANSNEELVQQLQQHLAQPFIYQFLSSPQSPEFKKSSLSLAHQQLPEDRNILCHLIDIYIETKELDKAMALAEKLATQARTQDDWQQLGNALLYQSTVLTSKDLYQLSADKLALATKAFENINDLSGQADAWNAQSWLDHKYDDYAAIKASLLKSAQLAFAAADKPRELHALTYLSVLAHKHQQEDDKYAYLRQAETKMNDYQLPIYHFAKVPFHYAIFAQTPQAKEPHLKQVLEFTKLTPDHWVAQSSRKQLVLQYIEQKRLQEAQALVEAMNTDNAQNSYLKTLLAKANLKMEEFIVHAQRTFEQAQLAGNHTLSLDVALLLCSTANIDVNYDFYSLYIDENASLSWRRDNEMKLLALNQ